MNTNNNNPNSKGLGWIPDYPDLRDYRLGSGDINDPATGRLKREERSKEIEQIAQEFTDFAEGFASFLDNIAKDSGIRSDAKSSKAAEKLAEDVKRLKVEIGNQVNEVQLAIFGDVSFESVNIYRQLRQGVKSKTPFSSSNEFLYESDTAKRIIELKSCLYFIFQAKKPPNDISHSSGGSGDIVDKISNTKESFKILTNPDKAFKWLKEESFDDDTDRFVQLFQYCADIWIDGIVGIETYTTLNEYLEYLSETEESRRKTDKSNKRFKNFNKRFREFFDTQKCKFYPSSSYQPRSRLLPVSLLLSKEVLKKFLSRLEYWAIKEVSESEEDIFEEDYLRKINVTNPKIFEELITEKKEKIDSLQNHEEQIKELSKIFFEVKNCEVKDDIEKLKFIDILQKEFHLVEPIVSAIIKILTPLANFRGSSLEDVVSKGLAEFEQILRSFDPANRQRPSKRQDKQLTRAASLDSTESTRVTEEFALQALNQVQVIFNAEIEFKIREKSSESSDTDAILYFYFLIKKMIRWLMPTNSQLNAVGTDRSNSQALNPFEKQEIFEVTKFCSSNRMEFFKIPNLQIPLGRKTLESFVFSNLAPTDPSFVKQYLFLPDVVDLSYWCSEIEDQGSLNSCTALAGVALLEYFVNRSNGRYTDASSLFLYKATRRLMNLDGDVGASVRETMKAMALFGIPPEQYWKYDESKVDEEPSAFCYSFAQSFQALKYFRLDYAGISKEVLLLQIKAVIATSFPCIFGFTIYTSAYETSNQRNGLIPFPNYKKDRVVGGHSVVAVGYDDHKKIERKDRIDPSEGAFLIRNSFGADWGDGGYGWLPYDYVLAGLTADWWSLLKAEWFSDDFWQGVRESQGPDPTERQP